VPARHARHRHRRHGREGDAAGQGVADGAIDMARAEGARAADEHRETAHRALRQGQRAGHRRAGPGRPLHRARRQDHDYPDPRGLQAGGDDPQLRRHPPRALHARRLRPGLRSSPVAGRVARRHWAPDTGAKRSTSTRSPAKRCRAGSRAIACCSTARC
jgi:hypothetical protein